jgi:hypothetical protein
MEVIIPLEMERRLGAVMPLVAERLRLSPQDSQWLQQEIIVQLFPNERHEVRRYEEVRTAVLDAWQGWLAHRTTTHADLYFGLLATELEALVRAARDQSNLRRFLVTGLTAAIRHRYLSGKTLTEAQIEALQEALSLLFRPDLGEATLAACEGRMEAAGLHLGPGLSGEALRQFVELCANDH